MTEKRVARIVLAGWIGVVLSACLLVPAFALAILIVFLGLGSVLSLVWAFVTVTEGEW